MDEIDGNVGEISVQLEFDKTAFVDIGDAKLFALVLISNVVGPVPVDRDPKFRELSVTVLPLEGVKVNSK